MRRGLSRRAAAGSSPSRSITPGRKFSISTSAWATSRSTRARSAGCLRSAAKLSLLRLMVWKSTLSPSISRFAMERRRPRSPPCGRSILTTRAPRSASRRAQEGPARNWLKSRTSRPARGRCAAGSGGGGAGTGEGSGAPIGLVRGEGSHRSVLRGSRLRLRCGTLLVVRGRIVDLRVNDVNRQR